MINHFKCLSSSGQVLGSLKLDQFLYTLKNGDDNLEIIEKARQIYHDQKKEYDLIKRTKLPCYTLNFTFDKVRRNESIIDSTGYLYIDVDCETDIDLSNPLVFASWISLSGTGRGMLVKIENLNPDNFKYVYQHVSKQLGINADMGACKPTQPNVLSYDPQVYTNYSSITYKAIDSGDEEIPHYSTINNKNPTMGTVLGSNFSSIRFDNLAELIDSVEFNDEVIHDYRAKVKYSEVYVKHQGIKDGERNNVLCGYAHQLRALNLNITYSDLNQVLKDINAKYCHPASPVSKIDSITKGVMNVVNIKPKLNKERRFLFNEDYDLTATEKRREVIGIINKDRVEESKRKIEKAIDDWDFEKEGKITQKGIAKNSGMNIKTIQKYYYLFRSQIQLLNQEFNKK